MKKKKRFYLDHSWFKYGILETKELLSMEKSSITVLGMHKYY